MALVSNKKSLAYRSVPLLYHREVYLYVTECFPDDEFRIQYESTDFESKVRILGYKFQGLKQRYPYAEARHSLPLKECLHFDIIQVDNPDARNTFATCFWVTIHSFAPCSPHWCSEGQIQSLMERMIRFMELLERTSPGEYRLKVCGGDGEVSFMFDENQIPGVKMRSLYTLSHGQTRLNALGIQDHLFHANHVKFNQILQNNFQFRGTANDVKTFHVYRHLLDVTNIPKTGQVFQGIYKRIRFWNDELGRDSNTVVDMKEVALYCKIIDGHVECVEKHFSSNASQLLKMQRVRAPEPEVQKDAAVKLPTTTALRLSKPYYISAFPTRAKEREEIKQEFRSRRKLHTS
jgi:hypothetical protein